MKVSPGSSRALGSGGSVGPGWLLGFGAAHRFTDPQRQGRRQSPRVLVGFNGPPCRAGGVHPLVPGQELSLENWRKTSLSPRKLLAAAAGWQHPTGPEPGCSAPETSSSWSCAGLVTGEGGKSCLETDRLECCCLSWGRLAPLPPAHLPHTVTPARALGDVDQACRKGWGGGAAKVQGDKRTWCGES